MSLETLQSLWNKGKYIQVLKGNNGLSKLVLKTSTSSCEIYIHGAHITSFKTNSIEHLFMSEKSGFQDMKAIRGGIPLIWPQFGNGKIQTHGFARNLDWEINKALVDEKSQSVQIEFLLKNNEYTEKVWNCNIVTGDGPLVNQFHTIYRVTLHPDFLDLEFDVKNTSTDNQSEPLEFQLAFHTYYQISNIENVYVLGLEGREYIDKMDEQKIKKEVNQKVSIDKEVDRVYLNVVPTTTGSGSNNKILHHQPLQLIDNDSKNSITLTYDYQSMPDVVIWNPWIEKSKKMEDFGNDEYHNMICIEVGVINTPVKLSQNQSFQTKHSILPSNKSSL